MPMQLAPYNQHILDLANQAISSMEPLALVGMYDCGIDFLFSRLVNIPRTISSQKLVIFLDLSLCIDPDTSIKEIKSQVDFSKLEQWINHRKLVLVAYLGQHNQTDTKFFTWLHKMMNLYRHQFSYVIFASARWYKPGLKLNPQTKKIFLRNFTRILPRDNHNTRIIISNYEERFGVNFTQSQLQTISKYSCGVPGLIKALCLQVINSPDWTHADWTDEILVGRLQGLSEDLLGEQTESNFYQDFGYSQLVEIKNHLPITHSTVPENNLLTLSPLERAVHKYLELHAGIIVSRENIARVMWGDNSTEKYSDWAIDQLFSQLRNKLSLIDYQAKIITKRGEGYIFRKS